MTSRSAVAAFLLLALGMPSLASESLRKEIRSLAENILKNVKNQPVVIGQFTPTGLPNTNSGPGLEELLKAELEAIQKGVVQAKNGKFEIKGDYGFVKDKDNPDLKVIRINARVIDLETGEDLKELIARAQIGGSEDIAALVQLSIVLPINNTKPELNEKLQEATKNPAVHIDGSKISASSKQNYAVELLVKKSASGSAQPKKAIGKDGLAFVDIERNEFYEVKLYNNTPHEAAITLSIDGLDNFTFSEEVHKEGPKKGQPLFTHWIIPAAKEGKPGVAVLKGWHRTNDPKQVDKNVWSFLVTAYGQGAASERKVSGRLGVLTVTFAASWDKDADKPEDEKGGRNSGGNETGRGPEISGGKFQPVKRNIGVVREIVSVRYTR